MLAGARKSERYRRNWVAVRESVVMPGKFAEGIGRQLAHPAGCRGHLIGMVMRIANNGPIERTVAAMAVEPHEVVLDIGCGSGAAVALLSRRAKHVHGLDQSTTMIAAARRRNRRAIFAGRVKLDVGTFEALPYPDRSFDAILAANIMYFWRDIPRVVQELTRVLRPGGRLAVYITSATTMGKWPFAGPETHRQFDESGVIDAFASAGIGASRLTITEVEFAGGIDGLIILVGRPPEI